MGERTEDCSPQLLRPITVPHSHSGRHIGGFGVSKYADRLKGCSLPYEIAPNVQAPISEKCESSSVGGVGVKGGGELFVARQATSTLSSNNFLNASERSFFVL